jgi:hypothetical protein
MSTKQKKGFALVMYVALAFAVGPYPIMKQAIKHQQMATAFR